MQLRRAFVCARRGAIFGAIFGAVFGAFVGLASAALAGDAAGIEPAGPLPGTQWRHPMAGASVTGAPGESGLMFLVNDSYYVNPLNNDIAGKTDKFLTHSSRFGWTRRWRNESLDIRTGWRFITPSFEIADGVQLRPPIGAYGDWAEVQAAYAVLFDDDDGLMDGIRPRLQLEAGLGHLGPKGARETQVDLHKELNNSWDHLTWVDQKRGVTSSAGIEAGLASGLWTSGNWRMAIYGGWSISSSPVMFQHMAKGAFVVRYGKSWGLSLEARRARQLGSLIFPDLRPARHEFAAGFLITRWYKPTVTVVGPYYRGDTKAQVFVDFINFNWPL
jgi:hypothetical protein